MSNSATWVTLNNGDEEMDIVDGFLTLRIRQTYYVNMNECKYVYDCGPFTSAPRYLTAAEAKSAAVNQAKNLLTRSLAEIDAAQVFVSRSE